MGSLKNMGRLRLIKDIAATFMERKRIWLLPVALLLLFLAGILLFLALSGPLAPFLYPLI